MQPLASEDVLPPSVEGDRRYGDHVALTEPGAKEEVEGEEDGAKDEREEGFVAA